MSITVTDTEPHVLIKLSDLRRVFNAMDVAYSELEAAVADGDVKEEVTDDLNAALGSVRTMMKSKTYRGESV